MIEIDGLTYTFPRAQEPALQDVSLAVPAGEFALLTGPSGAGKSTLLRCLNGLVPHFSGGTITGRVQVGGYNALEAGPRVLSKVVGFVFQSPESQAVLDRVEAEIAFGLENAAVPESDMRLRVEEVLNLLDLARLRDRPLSKLSGGERQRVAIATAMVLKPRILVLDEPTSQLDPQAAAELLQSLVRLNEELGLTVMLVEQRLERVVRYVDRLIYLEAGRIVTDRPVRSALGQIPDEQLPPLARLGRALGWQPLPLTVKEGRQFARQVPPPVGLDKEVETNGRTDPGRSPGAAPMLLEADDIHFAYNGRSVLQGVDLHVKRGEAVVLLGRNGSGKSTLLKCLVGLLKPARGRIMLAGESVNGKSVADICRQVAYLPQAPDDLLFADTVEEELAITLRNHGLTDGQLPLPPDGLLSELGLDKLGKHYPRDLSVGQRQRVALASIMVTVPKLLLLDEPTRGLDFSAKRDLIALWQAWQARGIGLLLVTHDVELTVRIADRVLVLGPGQIIADGPPAEVLGASALFAPQMARLFPGRGWLTVEDALGGLAI